MTDWYDAWKIEYYVRFNALMAEMQDWSTYIIPIDFIEGHHIGDTKDKLGAMFEHVHTAVWHLDGAIEGATLTKEQVFDLWLERAGETTI